MTAATLSWAAGLAIGVFLGVVGTVVSSVLLPLKTEAEPTSDPTPTPLEDLRVGDEVVVVHPAKMESGVVVDFDFCGDVFLDAWDGSSRWVSAKDEVFRVKPVDHEPYDWSEKGL